MLVIPHLLIVYGLRVLRYALTIIAFFTVLFTKQIPDSIFNVIVMTRRYTWRAVSYGAWLRESYPPFILEDGELAPMGGGAAGRTFPGDTPRPDVRPGGPAVPPPSPPAG